MNCYRCQGSGEEFYDEDDRRFYDVCYHCGGTGQVDEETDHHDRLSMVASALAYQKESEFRQWANSDPDGDGYDLGAYENGMMPGDYFRCRVWERTPEICQDLLAMSRSDQEFLIAWNEYDPGPGILERPVPTLIDELLKCEPAMQKAIVAFASEGSDDEFPF